VVKIPSNNFYLVRIDTSTDDFVRDEAGDATIFGWMEDATFDKYENRNQTGEVVVCPKHAVLQPGDRVTVKHFAADEDFQEEYNGEILYRVPLDSIYLYQREGYAEALHDYVFTEPTSPDTGKVIYTSAALGYLKPQQTIKVLPNGRYPVYVAGRLLWRVKEVFVVGVVEECLMAVK
jgi:hypothetical protein